MSHFLPARRQRKELTAFWLTTWVQAGVGSAAAEEEAGPSEAVYGTYLQDAGADGGRWWHQIVQPGSLPKIGVRN